MTSIIKRGQKINIRVSSVLSKDIKQFGKQFILDGNEDTCWNSDMGSPQWVSLQLVDHYNITGFSIQFQGGFVGKDCCIELTSPSADYTYTEPFYPDDINAVQTFHLQKPVSAHHVKFIFSQSTDFFGRIVIYSIDFLT